MKKKKILFGLLLAVGAISLASCGKKDEKKDDNTKTSVITSQRVNDSSTSIKEDVTSSTSKEDVTSSTSKEDITSSTSKEDITSSSLTNQQKTVTYKDPKTDEIVVLNTNEGVVSGLPTYEDETVEDFPFITTIKFIGWLVEGTENDYISNGTRLKRSVNLVADFEYVKAINTNVESEQSVISYRDDIKDALAVNESDMVGFSFYNDEYSQTFIKKDGVYKCLKSDITSSSDEDIVGNLFNQAGYCELSLAKAIEIYDENTPLFINQNGFVLIDYEGDVIYKYYYNFDGYCRKMECYGYNSSTQEETYNFTTYYTFFLERQMTDEEIDNITDNIASNASKVYIETEDEDQLCHNIELALNDSTKNYDTVYKSDNFYDGAELNFYDTMIELYFEYGSEIFYKGNEYIRCAIGGATYLFNLDGTIRSIDRGYEKTTFKYEYDDTFRINITYSKFISALFNGFEAKSYGLNFVVTDDINNSNLYILDDTYEIDDSGISDEINEDLKIALASGVTGALDLAAKSNSLEDAEFYVNGNYYHLLFSNSLGDYEFIYNELGQCTYFSFEDHYEMHLKPSLQQYSRVRLLSENNDTYSLKFEKFNSELEFEPLKDYYSGNTIYRYEYYDLDTNEPVENGQIIDKYFVDIVARKIQIEGCKCIMHLDYYDSTNSKTILLEKGELLKDVLDDPKVTGFIFDGWYTDSDFQNSLDMEQEVNSEIEIYAKLTPLTYSNYSINRTNQLTSFSSTEFKQTNLGCIRAIGKITNVLDEVKIGSRTILELNVAANAVVSFSISANKQNTIVPLYAVEKPTNLQLQNGKYFYIKDGKLTQETALVARDVQYYKAYTTTEFSTSGVATTLVPKTTDTTILLVASQDSTFAALKITYKDSGRI